MLVAFTAGENNVWAALGMAMAFWLAGGIATELAKKLAWDNELTKKVGDAYSKFLEVHGACRLHISDKQFFIIGATGISFGKRKNRCDAKR